MSVSGAEACYEPCKGLLHGESGRIVGLSLSTNCGKFTGECFLVVGPVSDEVSDEAGRAFEKQFSWAVGVCVRVTIDAAYGMTAYVSPWPC